MAFVDDGTVPTWVPRLLHTICCFIHHTLHANANAHRIECLAIYRTSHYPVRSSSSIHESILWFFTPVQDQTRHISSPSFVSSKHLSVGIFHSPRPAADSNKNLHQRHFFSLFASTHARTHFCVDYLCIYSPWRYLSRTKKKDFVTEDASRITPEFQKNVRSEQIHHSLSYPYSIRS